MRQLLTPLTWCIMLFSCVIYAQPQDGKPSWKETYKKAYAFATTQPDSALALAHQCLALTQNPQERHTTYYFIGYTAKTLCLYDLAKRNYQKALEFAPDSSSKYNAINELANTFLYAGNLDQATRLSAQNIAYQIKQSSKIGLGYAYQLQGAILLKQQHPKAIGFLQKALALMKEQASKDIGNTYYHVASAFAAFNRYDSAIVYQRLALQHSVVKTPDRKAYLTTKLAKYLVLSGHSDEALPFLNQAKVLQKSLLTEAYWCHAFALYLHQTSQSKYSTDAFMRCEGLIDDLLKDAHDIVTRKTLAEQAQEMYKDILALPRLPLLLRERYRGKLKTTEVRLASYTRELKLKDRLYLQQFAGSSSVQKGGGSSLFWVLCLLAGLLFLVGLDRYYHHRLSLMFLPSTAVAGAAAPVVVPELPLVAEESPVVVENEESTESANNEVNPEPDSTLEEVPSEEVAEETPVLTPSLTPAELYKAQALLHEEELVWLIEQQTGKPLSPKVRDMVRYYYQGLSIQEVAKEMGTKFDHVRYRFRTIVKDTEFKTMRALMDAYRSGELRRATGDDDASDEKA